MNTRVYLKIIFFSVSSFFLILLCNLIFETYIEKKYFVLTGDTARDVKLVYWEKHKDEFDVLFIGSSLIVRHIKPLLFDKMTTENGLKTTSFNLGFSGAALLETYTFIKKIISKKPKKLKYVVINLDRLLKTDHDKDSPSTLSRTTIEWHNYYSTYLAVEAVLDSKHSVFEKISLVKTHIYLYILKLFNVARLYDVLDASFKDDRTSTNNQNTYLGKDLDGFVQVNLMGEYFTETKKKFIEEKSNYENSILDENKRQPSDRIGRVVYEKQEIKVVYEIDNYLRKNGVLPIFVLTPVFEVERHFRKLADNGVLSNRILIYNDPVKFSELYKFENRFDWIHLDEKGAFLFSEMFAKDFAYLVRSQK